MQRIYAKDLWYEFGFGLLKFFEMIHFFHSFSIFKLYFVQTKLSWKIVDEVEIEKMLNLVRKSI